jgi:hypothetical protein
MLWFGFALHCWVFELRERFGNPLRFDHPVGDPEQNVTVVLGVPPKDFPIVVDVGNFHVVAVDHSGVEADPNQAP